MVGKNIWLRWQFRCSGQICYQLCAQTLVPILRSHCTMSTGMFTVSGPDVYWAELSCCSIVLCTVPTLQCSDMVPCQCHHCTLHSGILWVCENHHLNEYFPHQHQHPQQANRLNCTNTHKRISEDIKGYLQKSSPFLCFMWTMFRKSYFPVEYDKCSSAAVKSMAAWDCVMQSNVDVVVV